MKSPKGVDDAKSGFLPIAISSGLIFCPQFFCLKHSSPFMFVALVSRGSNWCQTQLLVGDRQRDQLNRFCALSMKSLPSERNPRLFKCDEFASHVISSLLAPANNSNRLRQPLRILPTNTACGPACPGNVVILHGNNPLNDNRAVIVFVVHDKVDGTAAHSGSARQHSFMNVMSVESLPTEGGNQRRMDVDNPVGIIIRNVEQRKKPATDRQIDLSSPAAQAQRFDR